MNVKRDPFVLCFHGHNVSRGEVGNLAVPECWASEGQGRMNAPVFLPAHGSLPLFSHQGILGCLHACTNTRPCWHVTLNYGHAANGLCSLIIMGRNAGEAAVQFSLPCVLADSRSSHILVLKTWLPLYHCLQTGHSCSQQHQLSWGSNKHNLSLPPFHICGCRGQPKWRHASYTSSHGHPSQWDRHTESWGESFKEDTGFCDSIKTSRGEVCAGPQRWVNTSVSPPPHQGLIHSAPCKIRPCS